MTKSNSQLVVILDNIRSAFNVGSILRSADAAGADKVFMCGYTTLPSNPKVLKTSLGSEQSVDWEHHCTTIGCIRYLHSQGFFIVAVENISKGVSMMQAEAHQQIGVILGNEIHGVSDEAMEMADEIVFIPQLGKKESLNVSVACGVILYEYSRKMGKLAG